MKTKMSDSEKQFVWSEFRPTILIYSIQGTIFFIVFYLVYFGMRLPDFSARPFNYQALATFAFIFFVTGIPVFISYKKYNKIMQYGNKIVTEINVTDKCVTKVKSGKSRKTVYRLFFRNNAEVEHYDTNRIHFDQIAIGDRLDIAYTEQEAVVLKLEHEAKDIRFDWKKKAL